MTAPSRPAAPHKERLLGSGMRLLYAHGYHGMSVDAVLADSGVPKGSFYHHFGSKEAFAFAVLDRYDAYQAEILDRWFHREDLPVPDRLAGYYGEFIERFTGSGWKRSCLTGKLSTELAASSASFRGRLAAALNAWKTTISALLGDGQRRGEVRADEPADRLADGVLAMIQGAFVYALAVREDEYLAAVTHSLVDFVTTARATRAVVPELPATRTPHSQDALPHRKALLREGMNQFFERGFHGTTVDRLLEVTGVPKGSFYHHFGSKEVFAEGVLDSYGGFQSRRLAAWSVREDLSTAEAICGYFAEMSRIFVESGFRNSDLAGKLATEVAASSEPLRARIARLVRDWRAQVEEILVAGRERGDVRTDRDLTELSAAIGALIDGAFVVVASTRSRESLDAVAAAIASLVAADDSPAYPR